MNDPKEFCAALDQWADLLIKQQGNVNEGTETFQKYWFAVRLAIRKSCLLDRLIYGGEKPSQTPCPVHKGKWSGCHWGWPGSISIAISEHDGHLPGDAFPAPVNAQMQEWYDAGCRCAYHNCGCTTGWQPDAHCGCGGEAHRKQVIFEKYELAV